MITRNQQTIHIFNMASKSWRTSLETLSEEGSKTVPFANSHIAVNFMKYFPSEIYSLYYNWKTYKFEKLSVKLKINSSAVIAVLAVDNSIAQCTSSDIN